MGASAPHGTRTGSDGIAPTRLSCRSQWWLSSSVFVFDVGAQNLAYQPVPHDVVFIQIAE